MADPTTDASSTSTNDAPDASCKTCGGSTKTNDQQHGLVSYMQGNAGPVTGTYYYSPDGSVSQFAVGTAPTSTGFSGSGGICAVTANDGSTVGDVVSGGSTGLTASTGTGAEVSYSQNPSGSMTCVGASTGTPGVSPTAGYAMTPTEWANTVAPSPTILPSNEAAFDQYGEPYLSNTGTLQDDAEDALRQ